MNFVPKPEIHKSSHRKDDIISVGTSKGSTKVDPNKVGVINFKFGAPDVAKWSDSRYTPYYAIVYVTSLNSIGESNHFTLYVYTEQGRRAAIMQTVSTVSGEINQGTVIDAQYITKPSTAQTDYTLFYPGSDLDLHLYDPEGHHVGVNYDTGEIEIDIIGATYSGPDSIPEQITIDNSGGKTYTTEIVAIETSGNESYSLITIESPKLPPLVSIFPSNITISGSPGEKVNAALKLREYGGFSDLNEIEISSTDLTNDAEIDIPSSNVAFDIPSTTISAGSNITVNLTIDIPKTAEPGKTYIGSIRAIDTSGATDNASLCLTIYTPKTIFVDSNFADSSVRHEWNTINKGILDANNGDTIYVYNGTYHENILLNKELALIGENKNATIIDGGGSGKCINVTADNVRISGFTLRNGTTGILLYPSSNTIICGNNISANGDGINLYSINSDENIIADNYISDNTIGIVCLQSNNNLINNNMLFNNYYGIYLSSPSSNNTIYQNNFVGNTNPTHDGTGTNQWDNDYPSGGNYWSRYTGDDYYSGPNQDIPGSDGIIDAPYDISGDAGAQDNYPFVNKDGWSTKDLIVTVLHPNGGEFIPIGTQVQVSAHATDDTTVTSVTFSYSNNSGSNWNPIGAGAIVSGTNKDGIWDGTWNTNNLGAGSNYLIRAVASDGTSLGEDQSDGTFSLTCTPPSTPTLNDPGTTDTDGNYTVSWSSVSGATNYTLEEDTSGLFGSPTVVYSGSGTSKYITGRSGGTYYYRVKACNACGCGGGSNVEDIEVSILHAEEGWNRTFGGADSDVAYSVQQTSDGGFILAGYTDSYGAGGSDFWLVKTDSNGTEQWNMTVGGTDYDIARSVQETSDDGYIIAGWYFSAAGKCDARLVRIDSSGGILWHLTFGGAGWDVVESVQQTSDGSFIITGDTDSYGAGHYDAWLVKIDPYGCIQWNKTFGGFGRDVAESVRQTSDGGYIIAGSTQPLGSYLFSTGFVNPLGIDFADAWLVKIDSNGNKQWDKTFGGADWDTAESVQETSDGGYILAGYTKSIGAGDSDFWLIKTYSNGSKQWDKTFGETNDDYAYSVQQTSDDGYILAGVTELYIDPSTPPEIPEGGSDVWLVKTDSEGGKEWDKTFGGTDDDYASSVQQTSDGGYVLAGCTKSYGAGSSDFWLIKLGTAAQMRGDLNRDGTLTPADAAIALELAATGSWDPAADMSGDNRITSLDALMILQAAGGAITL